MPSSICKQSGHNKLSCPSNNLKTQKNTPVYLGQPNDDNDWLNYLGSCRIFAGIKYVEYDPEYEDELLDEPYWIMEDQDIIKNKLTEELNKVGVKCENIIIHNDTEDGLMHCKCECLYNKPYIVYESEFFLDGLSEFPPENRGPLEFYFEKRINT